MHDQKRSQQHRSCASHRLRLGSSNFGETTIPVTGTNRSSHVRETYITRQAEAPAGAWMTSVLMTSLANIVQISLIKVSQTKVGDSLCLGVKPLDILSLHAMRKEERRSE
jgi:hypothetical protein